MGDMGRKNAYNICSTCKLTTFATRKPVFQTAAHAPHFVLAVVRFVTSLWRDGDVSDAAVADS